MFVSGRGNLRIGIIGGGLMGMALARKLAADGADVTVLERDQRPGGLATWHDFGPFIWDRFYHVILPSDRNLIEFIGELQMTDQLAWQRTYTGFYVDGCLHSVSSNVEFIKFPLLSLFSKARLAWTMLYAARINDWTRLEKITVSDWLIRVSGRKTYEKMWKPLLLAKLGNNYRRVSAVFIWSYIKRLFSARHSAASKEQLGHVAGGYKSIFERIIVEVESAGGSVRTGVAVRSVKARGGSGMIVLTDSDELQFDRVVCTSPVPVLKQLVDTSLLNIENDKATVEYLGVICVVIVSTTRLVPYYVVNIADDAIPFTGVIGMTNAVSRDNTAGFHVTYLPKYAQPEDPVFRRSDESIKEEFLDGVRRMLPEFDMEAITSVHVNRAERVQPLQVLHYSKLVPTIATRHPDLFALNTAQFVNATLNNNEVIGAVNEFYSRHRDSLLAAPVRLTQAG